jgi:response regulator RpfG family c-di-GMP phosphodiesterase
MENKTQIKRTFTVSLVDSNVKFRNNLRQLAQAVTVFKKTTQLSSLDEALVSLSQNTPCDIIFLSQSFYISEIKDFIGEAKKTVRGEECAFIMVATCNNHDEAIIAQSIIAGCHAILSEPYSVDRMYEIAEIANKIKLECEQKRKYQALSLLTKLLAKELDSIALYVKSGFSYEKAKKKLLEVIVFIKDHQLNSFDLYIQVLIDTFAKSLPSPKLYSGGSARLKKKMENKIKEEVEKV